MVPYFNLLLVTLYLVISKFHINGLTSYWQHIKNAPVIPVPMYLAKPFRSNPHGLVKTNDCEE